LPADRPLDHPFSCPGERPPRGAIADIFAAPVAKLRAKVQYSRLLQGKVIMRMSKLCCAPVALLLIAVAARTDTLADWADKTIEIATDSPNTIRTMAIAQNAVYEAVNAITSRYPHDRLDLGPAAGDFHIFNVWGMQDKPAMIIGMDVLGTAATLSIDFKNQDVYVGSVRAKSDMFSVMRRITEETTQKR
jgi:hypothetical protein